MDDMASIAPKVVGEDGNAQVAVPLAPRPAAGTADPAAPPAGYYRHIRSGWWIAALVMGALLWAMILALL